MSEESITAHDTEGVSKKVAFIGLGHMGGPMAANLVAAGYQVHGFDVVPAALVAAAETGVMVCDSSAQAARGADVIITMLPAGKHVFAALEGEGPGGGLLAAAKPEALFLECSTISVEDARATHKLVSERGHRALDAPVSGGVMGAQAGTLTVMVGGSEEDFGAAKNLFDVMGKRIVLCGGPGAGQAAKVCNNMILGVSMIAVSEAFVLGEKLGLTHQALFDVAANASGQCWSLTTNCPVPGPVPTSPANRDYQPGFSGALMAKDLGLAVEALNATGVDAIMGRTAEEIYREFTLDGGASTDFSSIINTIRAASSNTEAD